MKKNRIALITFHASHNYGSVLQAYALSKQLQLLGFKVNIINYRNKAQKSAYKIIKNDMTIYHKLFSLFIYLKLLKRFKHFERFINQVLPVTAKEYNTDFQLKNEAFDYDVFICGSDQIWNPHCQDFNTSYYLDFIQKNQKKISYAPSLGRTEFTKEQLDLIKSLISEFHFISIREKQGLKLLKTLTDKDISIVCDPVLLLEKKFWENLSIKPKIKKPYILTYFLENNHGDKRFLEKIKKETGFCVVALNECIKDFLKPNYKAFSSSPEEFVGYFKSASFIYTNSFHGTAFATIFNKPFITAVSNKQHKTSNNNDCRKIDYLEMIGLSDRIISSDCFISSSLLNIDFTESNKKIKVFRESSLSYLENAIKSCLDA